MENLLPCIREEEFHSITKKINEFLKNKEYDKAFQMFVLEVSKVNKFDMDDFFQYYKKFKV